MKRLLQMLLIALFLSVPPASAAEPPALEIGIWPYMSTQALLTLYHPLQRYLEHGLQKPVLFVTAPDQRAFVGRTLKGEYRFVITAPHFARLAQKEAGYVPMLRPKRDMVSLLLVNKNSAIRSVDDLRGKTVTLPEKVTLVAILTMQMLRENGLEPGRDIKVRYAASHNSAMLDVLRGESAAAATAATILDQMPEKDRGSFRILARTGKVPPLVILANPGVPEKEVADMTRTLLDFTEHSPEGDKFLKRIAWQGLRPPAPGEMRSLDPYVADLNRLLKSSR